MGEGNFTQRGEDRERMYVKTSICTSMYVWEIKHNVLIIGIFKGIIDQESVFNTKEQTKKSRLAWIEIDIDGNIYTLHSVITIWPTYSEIIICFGVQWHQNITGSKRPKKALTSHN